VVEKAEIVKNKNENFMKKMIARNQSQELSGVPRTSSDKHGGLGETALPADTTLSRTPLDRV